MYSRSSRRVGSRKRNHYNEQEFNGGKVRAQDTTTTASGSVQFNTTVQTLVSSNLTTTPRGTQPTKSYQSTNGFVKGRNPKFIVQKLEPISPLRQSMELNDDNYQPPSFGNTNLQKLNLTIGALDSLELDDDQRPSRASRRQQRPYMHIRQDDASSTSSRKRSNYKHVEDI